MQKLIHELRCLVCEVLIGWAMKICPEDYTPSAAEIAVDAYLRRGKFADIK